jgi:hypothetical protein
VGKRKSTRRESKTRVSDPNRPRRRRRRRRRRRAIDTPDGEPRPKVGQDFPRYIRRLLQPAAGRASERR